MRGARRITAKGGRKECKKSGKRGRKKWEEGAGGREGRRGERNSFNARALPRFISHLSRRESGSHWVLDGTVTRHLLSGGTRGTRRGRDARPASDWPIRHGEVGSDSMPTQLWTPRERRSLVIFVVRKDRRRRPPLAPMGMGGQQGTEHGNGRIRKFGDGNRCREKRGRLWHSLSPLSLFLLLLCYVMLWILLCLLVFYEVWIWLHIRFTISVQFCPVNGALKKKIFTVNRTCVRGYVCTCSLRASYWSRHRYCNIIHLLLGNNISQIEGTQTLINIRNSISLRIRSIPRTVLDYINFKIEILITIIYFYLLIIKKKRRKIFTPIDTQTCFN